MNSSSHRICSGSSGSENPASVAMSRKPSNATWVETRKTRPFWTLAMIRRPSRMAKPRVAKESSLSTRSDAPLATAVPLPMATATSAAWSAGASLTPSPVTAIVRPARCAAWTMRSFWLGVARATTPTEPSSVASRSSDQPSISAPVTTRGVSSPASWAMASAVAGWSPVTTRTWMPAPWTVPIASAMPGRSGSAKAMTARGIHRPSMAASDAAAIPSIPRPSASSTNRSPAPAPDSTRSSPVWPGPLGSVPDGASTTEERLGRAERHGSSHPVGGHEVGAGEGPDVVGRGRVDESVGVGQAVDAKVGQGGQQAGRERARAHAIGHAPGIVLGPQGIEEQVASSLGLEHLAVGRPHAANRQPVLGQGAGLVGQDEIDGTERLLGVQVSDEHAALEQAVGTQPEDDRQEDGRLLRDGRDGRRDAGQDVLAERIAAHDAQAEGDGDEPDGDDEQDLDQPIELQLERGASAFVALEALGDDPDLAGCAGGHDDAFSPAGDDARSRIGDRMALVEGRIRAVRRDRAGLGQRLAGQQAAIDEQALRPGDPNVGGHDVAAAQQHDVARHQRHRRQVLDLTVAPSSGHRGAGLAQGLEGALAAVLGHDVGADDGQQPDQHQQAVATLTHDDGQGTGDRQQHDEGLRGRLEEHVGDRLVARRLELVGADRCQAGRGVRGAQALGGIDRQRPSDLVGGQGKGARQCRVAIQIGCLVGRRRASRGWLPAARPRPVG